MLKKLLPRLFKLLSFLSPQLAAKYALKLFLHPRRKQRSDEEMDFLATGQEVTFASRRKARTWGSGEVIWLLHGWESRGSTFYKLIPLLVDRGFQVVAWDAPAHGDSPGTHTNVPDYAQSLKKDVQQGLFKRPVAFVGHSFGGASLAVLAQIYTLPVKLVIVSAPTQVSEVFEKFIKMIGLNQKARTCFIELAEKSSGYSLQDCSLIANDLSLQSDVLVIHDRDDDVIPFTDYQVIEQQWNSGTFLATEKLGHRMTIKEASVLETIVDFITDSAET